MYEMPFHYNVGSKGTTYSPVLHRMVKLTAPMISLVRALNKHGYVDPIRDGGTVGTFVALMNRGILREAKGRYGRHYPAHTPEQVWEEAHTQHRLFTVSDGEITEHAEAVAENRARTAVEEQRDTGSMVINVDSINEKLAAVGRGPINRTAILTRAPIDSLMNSGARSGPVGGMAQVGPEVDAMRADAAHYASKADQFAVVTRSSDRTKVLDVEGPMSLDEATAMADRAHAAGSIAQVDVEPAAVAPSLAGDVAALLTQYGTLCAEVAVQRDDRLAVEPFDRAQAIRREILDRLTAQAPQPATNLDGNRLWLHPCGRTYACATDPQQSPCICGLGGTWRALFVGGAK